MEIILCYGGRDYSDAAAVDVVLSRVAQDRQQGEWCIKQGGAQGADRLCAEWGSRHGIPVLTMAAHWDFFGKRAGPIRNQWMIDAACPRWAIEFPGGAGTQDMRRRLTERGIHVWRPYD